MKGSILSIDFETRSTLDLKQVGLPRYSTHPDTDIWCLAFGWSDSMTREVFVWTPLDEKPAVMCDWVRDGGLVSAWNAGFELAIWSEILTPRYGFPPLSPKQCVDTMFLAQARGLPGGLDDCAKALRLNIRKDAEGSRLMMRMCKPRKVQPDNTVIWWDDAERVSRLIEYCRQDVRVEQDILKRLPPVIPSEQRHWELTHEINQRGVYLDRALIDGAQTVLAEQVKALNQELRELTQGRVQSATAVAQLRAFVSEALDMPLETLDKNDVSRLLALGDDLPPLVKRILEIRQEIGKSSTGKLKAMLNRMSPDSRIRGLFRMHGAASTGRYTSVALQLQNLPRKAVKPPRVLGLIIAGDRDGVELFSADTVMSTISAAIRPMIAAPPGKLLLDADYSQIESRFTAWLADDQDKLEVFRQNRDVYKMVGSGMFGIPEDEVVGDLRQSAKTAELACIAEDSLVLTDTGLVPIQHVTTAMRVWDGCEFVTHDGPIFKGIQEVMTYDGLTATPDHLVFTHDGRTLSLGECARQQIPLAQTGLGRQAVWVGYGDFARSHLEAKGVGPMVHIPNAPLSLSRLRKGEGHQYGQPVRGKDQGLSGLLPKRFCSEMVGSSVDCGKRTLHQPQRSRLESLRRARDSLRVFLCLGSGALSYAGVRTTRELPPFGARSNRQQRALRPGQSATCAPQGQSSQSPEFQRGIVPPVQAGTPEYPVCRQHLAESSGEGPILRGHHSPLPPQVGQTQRRVWDILNAGPRHRFTVSGKLVHNCGFGGGIGALFAMAEAYGLKLTEDEAQDIVTRWREANPKTKALWYTLKDAAFAAMKTPNTWFGAQDNRVGYCYKGNSLRCQLPSGRQIVYPWAELIQVPAPWDSAKLIDAIQYEGFSAKQGNKWVKRIAWHGILVENIVQGACADILRHALELLEADGSFYTVAHIHDEIICEVPEADGPRLLTRMIDLMSRTPAWAEGLPLTAEGKHCKRFTK